MHRQKEGENVERERVMASDGTEMEGLSEREDWKQEIDNRGKMINNSH